MFATLKKNRFDNFDPPFRKYSYAEAPFTPKVVKVNKIIMKVSRTKFYLRFKKPSSALNKVSF